MTQSPHTLSFQRSDDVRHIVENGILKVTIDRPEKRNPLSLGVLDRLREIFSDSAEDDAVSLAVVTGSGQKAFASGGDLTELSDYRTLEDAASFSRHGKAALDSIRTFPVPVIAKVNGLALGGGAELALACDMRFAAATASIGFIHARLNIAPSWGGGHDLGRLVGPSSALRMMSRAEIFDSQKALDMGLFDATASSPESNFDAEFDAFIDPMLTNPRQVMRAQKSIALGNRLRGKSEADLLETEHFGRVWTHQDHWDAVANLARKTRS